nr:6-phospho-beta-glucosidase [Klebsiella pneumoniae]
MRSRRSRAALCMPKIRKEDTMQALKIAVIGGGSSYTPELIEGIIVRYEQLPVTELALVDVESGRKRWRSSPR